MSELDRLRGQLDAARSALDGLLDQRQRALDGAGASPRQADIDRAKARLEVAEELLRAHQRTVRA